MWSDRSLTSNNGRYQLVMQGDGSLVTYTDSNHATFASGTDTFGGAPSTYLVVQNDGNLVMYRWNGFAWPAIWSTNTQ